jgi:Sigma-70, region 4
MRGKASGRSQSLGLLPRVTLDTFGDSELGDLDHRTAHILRMRAGMMGEPASRKEIGEELGIKGERVRQLENEGLALIRHLREVQRHRRLQPIRRRGYPGYIWKRLRRLQGYTAPAAQTYGRG